jgi:hypothetical protein
MITDLITSGAMHSLKSVFQKKKERNVIIDPFSCLVKLSLIRYLDEGTKISIYQNRLNFNAPSYIQGIVRFVYGDNREDLHNILLPIQKCVEWYWNDRNTDMIYMFNNAVLGLKFLKNSYSTYATIQHTLDYYIIILMQKNTAVMSKMGISTIDIERLTQTLLDSNSASASASISISLQNESPIPNNNSNNNSNEKGKNKDTRDIARDIARDTEKESRGKDSKDKKSEPKEQKEHDALQHKQNEKQNEKQQDKLDMELHMQMRDIHKFLFELWNEREMGIVINLYREMETKQPGTERNYIYNNIMQYCEMKENKLYKYIEQNSSIL